jgi:uncharacterized tellurite resistance protein B-like protein
MASGPASEIESALLSAIRQFFETRGAAPVEAPGPDDPGDTVSGRRLQLATTVLFLQMIAADRESKHDEHHALIIAVARVLRIGGEEAIIIIRLAEEHVKTPLPQLLRMLKERCTGAQLKNVVTNLWQLAFADAELAGHEEYFVRKVAQALGLNTADLVETKILAREAFLSAG